MKSDIFYRVELMPSFIHWILHWILLRSGILHYRGIPLHCWNHRRCWIHHRCWSFLHWIPHRIHRPDWILRCRIQRVDRLQLGALNETIRNKKKDAVNIAQILTSASLDSFQRIRECSYEKGREEKKKEGSVHGWEGIVQLGCCFLLYRKWR